MKLGIIGAGKIVKEFLPSLTKIEGLEITGIMSTPKSLDKVKALAAEYGIPHGAATFEELCATGMDTVYVAVPNHLHYEYGKKALEQAGLELYLPGRQKGLALSCVHLTWSSINHLLDFVK